MTSLARARFRRHAMPFCHFLDSPFSLVAASERHDLARRARVGAGQHEMCSQRPESDIPRDASLFLPRKFPRECRLLYFTPRAGRNNDGLGCLSSIPADTHARDTIS